MTFVIRGIQYYDARRASATSGEFQIRVAETPLTRYSTQDHQYGYNSAREQNKINALTVNINVKWNALAFGSRTILQQKFKRHPKNCILSGVLKIVD